nr:Uncharacterised protein [Escherichia coli]
MPRVRAIVQHLRRHRVPEDMARARFVDPCRFPDRGACHRRQRVAFHPAAVFRHEQMTAVALACHLWPHVFQIPPQPRQRHMAHRNDPIPVAFTLPDVHHATPGIHIPQHQVRQLHPPDPGTPEHLKDDPVTQANRRVDIRAL